MRFRPSKEQETVCPIDEAILHKPRRHPATCVGYECCTKQSRLFGEFVKNAYFRTQTSVDCAMHNEQENIDKDDLSEIWRAAQFRRTEEIGEWLKHFFDRRRQIKALDSDLRHHQGRTAARI
jgi:hypothetical protein